jgi:hypothetical protein
MLKGLEWLWGGITLALSGDRGIFSGYSVPYANVIQYITISSTGNATDFGDLTYSPDQNGVCCNGLLGTDRMLSAGGTLSGGNANIIDYITVSSTGNATDFGDLSGITTGKTGLSNGSTDRGVFAGNLNTDSLEYVTISSTGDATDFGNLSVERYDSGSVSNGVNDRGVVAGGYTGSYSNVIDYITISSTGTATDFGDITVAAVRGLRHGASNDTRERGCFFGGNRGSGYTNVIEYITINSPSNATDFGDLGNSCSLGGGLSNGHGDRGVVGNADWSPGGPGTEDNTIEYITISSIGNATDFGDMITHEEGGGGAGSNGQT